MKLVVDMSPETFIAVKNLVAVNLGRSSCKTITEDVFNSLKNAIPIPDNATNGDVISREAVRNIVEDIRDCISVEGYWAILERLKMLPSVKQEPKTGHWIHFATSDDCSECGWSTGKYISPSKYCPNCGAKMVEPQESEG